MLFNTTIESPFQLAIVIYLIIITLLFIIRPPFIFDNPNVYHKFGLTTKDKKRRKTLFPLWLLFLLLAIIIYYTTISYTN